MSLAKRIIHCQFEFRACSFETFLSKSIPEKNCEKVFIAQIFFIMQQITKALLSFYIITAHKEPQSGCMRVNASLMMKGLFVQRVMSQKGVLVYFDKRQRWAKDNRALHAKLGLGN